MSVRGPLARLVETLVDVDAAALLFPVRLIRLVVRQSAQHSDRGLALQVALLRPRRAPRPRQQNSSAPPRTPRRASTWCASHSPQGDTGRPPPHQRSVAVHHRLVLDLPLGAVLPAVPRVPYQTAFVLVILVPAADADAVRAKRVFCQKVNPAQDLAVHPENGRLPAALQAGADRHARRVAVAPIGAVQRVLRLCGELRIRHHVRLRLPGRGQLLRPGGEAGGWACVSGRRRARLGFSCGLLQQVLGRRVGDGAARLDALQVDSPHLVRQGSFLLCGRPRLASHMEKWFCLPETPCTRRATGAAPVPPSGQPHSPGGGASGASTGGGVFSLGSPLSSSFCAPPCAAPPTWGVTSSSCCSEIVASRLVVGGASTSPSLGETHSEFRISRSGSCGFSAALRGASSKTFSVGRARSFRFLNGVAASARAGSSPPSHAASSILRSALFGLANIVPALGRRTTTSRRPRTRRPPQARQCSSPSKHM